MVEYRGERLRDRELARRAFDALAADLVAVLVTVVDPVDVTLSRQVIPDRLPAVVIPGPLHVAGRVQPLPHSRHPFSR